jgi:hypothetical protein
MSNVAGKAYAMTVVTPMKPVRTWINRLIFMVARISPSTLSGLLGLSLIHFARWVIVRRDQWPDLGQCRPQVDNDYMIFCSNFNGTWDQYIDAFSDGIPNGLDLFWYSSTKYPSSVPISPFKQYICHNQVQTNYYYNATPGAAQRDVKAALRVYKELRALEAKHKAMAPDDFAEEYALALVRVQNDLGSPGPAPVASTATDDAERNRRPFVEARWAAAAAGVARAA